jgi:hypothetical protein
MKKLILLLLVSVSCYSHSIEYKGCVDGKLKFYYHIGHSKAINHTLTLVDKNGNALTGSCAYSKTVSASDDYTFEIPVSLCNDYTRVKIKCSAGDYTGYKTVSKSQYCSAALPIKVSNLWATVEDNVTTITWLTSSEFNFSHFEIIASNNLKEEFSQGKTNNTFFVYEGVHKYIRLKAIDLDGSYAYTSWIAIKSKEESIKFIQKTPVGNMYLKRGIKTIVND